MKYASKLFAARDIYADYDDELFLNAVRENVQYHYRKNPQYKQILDSFGFDVKNFSSLNELPPLTTAYLKKHDINTLKHTVYTAHSSGTSGQKSAINCEVSGLYNLAEMAIKTMKQRDLFTRQAVHYIILGYKPHSSNNSQAVRTALLATMMAPAISRSYAINHVNGKYELQLSELLKTLQRLGRSKAPCRLVGFPSYAYFLCRLMKERDIRISLPAGSRIILGGGWKEFYSEEVDKSVFYSLAEETLGIKEKDIIEVFSAVEHPIVYCDCPSHHFHIPVYSRVIIRDPRTLQPLDYGQTGIINFISPIFKGSPIVSIMTDDLGVLHRGEECSCGIASPYFEVVGRVGMKNVQTCVQGAAEILKEIGQ